MFGEGRIIEQRIVKNIDGTNSDFLFFYTNTTVLTFHVQAFLANNHHLILSAEQNDVDFWFFKFPAKVYAISRGSYFIDFDIFRWSGVTKVTAQPGTS
jgi:alpha-glucosidase (family GH31 glycosyl hydrolase)